MEHINSTTRCCLASEKTSPSFKEVKCIDEVGSTNIFFCRGRTRLLCGCAHFDVFFGDNVEKRGPAEWLRPEHQKRVPSAY